MVDIRISKLCAKVMGRGKREGGKEELNECRKD